MSNNDKDIYELLNNTEFDITDEVEISINDIQKKKMKKMFRKNIKRKGISVKQKAVAAAIILAIGATIVSPAGQDVIAAIKEKLFFNPGLGLVSIEEETYVLNEPLEILNNNEEILIKSAISKKGLITIGLWINDEMKTNITKGEILNEKNDIKESIYIKTKDEQVIRSDNYAKSGGGPKTFITISFPTVDILKEFTLVVNNNEVNINLINSEERANYDEVGGNSTLNDLLIGGNMYKFNDETYLSLWSDAEVKKDGPFYIGYSKENINVSDKDGNKYNIEPSNYDGQGKEFYIGKNVLGPLDVNISQVDLEYDLRNPVNIKINIPKKGETIELNKEVYIEELDEKILLKSIKATDDGVEVYFDTEKYEKENSDIIMVNTLRRGWGIGASPDDKQVVLGIYYEDLTMNEKLSNKLNLNISRVMITKYGDWKFTVE